MKPMRLPEDLRPLFWDVAFEELEVGKDRDFIVSRLAESGTDRAVRWLQTAYETRDADMVLLNVFPVWDPLRSDPRFREHHVFRFLAFDQLQRDRKSSQAWHSVDIGRFLTLTEAREQLTTENLEKALKAIEKAASKRRM